jgi:hypothetical protein
VDSGSGRIARGTRRYRLHSTIMSARIRFMRHVGSAGDGNAGYSGSSSPFSSSSSAFAGSSSGSIHIGVGHSASGNRAMASAMGNSTANGVLIGLLSSFGSAILIALLIVVVYFFKYTTGGRILLDRIGRPGEYDDEQAFLREEAEALETMEEGMRIEYLRAKGVYCLVFTPLLTHTVTTSRDCEGISFADDL